MVVAVASTVVRVSELCVLVGWHFFFRNRGKQPDFKKKRHSKFRSVFAKPNLDNLLYNPQQLDFPERRSVLLERDALDGERDRMGLLCPAK